GLIFASMGSMMLIKGMPVISSATYSAIVIMIISSTLVTPPILKVTLMRGERLSLSRKSEEMARIVARKSND
ncbi:MAG TPA: hypothetical protein VMW38_27470, partial [Terriglobia bacterium]|nr:hypothetical protein [Terriglobia bacterium]